MLKNLLSTLIETVFTNKKSYIAKQCLPNDNNILQELSQKEGAIVVPFDGWARIQAQCNALQAASCSCVATINNQNLQWPSIVLPVRKGTNLLYNVIDGFDGQVSIWFVHNQTNE